jgi:hypothetical protein
MPPLPMLSASARSQAGGSGHHCGQLLVYLRLLDVPVLSVYGPSADENPFNDLS